MRFRRLLYGLIAALMATALGLMAVSTAREQGWRAVGMAFVWALPILGVLGLVFLAIGLMDRRDARMQKRYFNMGRCVRGTVVRIERPMAPSARLPYEVIAEFACDGRTYTAASGKLPGQPRVGVGDAINVYCNPDDPADNRILDIDVM